MGEEEGMPLLPPPSRRPSPPHLGTPSLPETHPVTPEREGLPTMHATLVWKGNNEAEGERGRHIDTMHSERERPQGELRRAAAWRSAGEGECQRRGRGVGIVVRVCCTHLKEVISSPDNAFAVVLSHAPTQMRITRDALVSERNALVRRKPRHLTIHK